MTNDEILTAAKWRRAIKKFDPNRKISVADWQFLLEIARFSPSSFGFEPWNIIVLQDQKLRDQLAPVSWGAAPQLASCSHFVIFTVKTDLSWQSKYYFDHILPDTRHISSEDIDDFRASFKAFQEDQQDLTDARKRHDWAAKQAYIAMANMMNTAALIGVDSCAIEGFYLADVEKILSGNNVVDLTTDRVAVMAAFGYRSDDPLRAKTRRELDEIVKTI
jgi:nitroreductase